ncbi:MAG: cytotoxic translational repressor of toxin-antitoxin stability system [Actinomycetota bacterium]|nr:cytotoxic translational repressor of toxin-antitoxin stability system [Actinomycetota bacterium]
MRNARGKPVRHHMTFELPRGSGAILRTRISRPANKETYGPRLWSAILNDQLCVSEEQFWDCVSNGVVPVREEAPEPKPSAIPASLAYQLIHVVGLPQDQVAGLGRDEAIAIMAEHWAQPGREV